MREIADNLRFDFLLVSDSDGKPLAGVVRIDNQLVAMDIKNTQPPQKGFFSLGANTFQVTSFPINVNQENLGAMSIGERFDLAEFGTPTVLSRYGKVLRSSIPGAGVYEVEAALRSCDAQAECEARLGSETYLTLPSDNVLFGDGYALRSLQSEDPVSGPVQLVLQHVFLIAGFGALVAAAALSGFSSRSIVRLIAAVVSRLRESEKTGLLPDFQAAPAGVQEIRELTDSFHRAAAAVREGRDQLQQAYVEFIGSLANTSRRAR